MRWHIVEVDTLMPWVRFTENFDWQPTNVKWMVAFKKGSSKLVKRSVANEAIKKGKAVLIERPEHRRANHHGVK